MEKRRSCLVSALFSHGAVVPAVRDSLNSQRMENSEAIEVALAKAGDREAFRQLVSAWPRLFTWLFRMTGNTHGRRRGAGELPARFGARPFRRARRFGTWLYRIAANCALDWFGAANGAANGRRRQMLPRS